jgi:hypothetical protein
MSTEAPNWYVTHYTKTAKHTIQSKGFLTRGMAEEPVDIVGNKARFFIIGKGKAVKRDIHKAEPVKPMNLGKKFVELELEHWQAAEYIPHGEPETMSVELKGKVAEAGAMAIGREHDFSLFRTLDADGTISTIDSSAAAMSPIVGNTAKARISALGADLNGYFCPLPSIAFEQMKLYKVFNSAEYTGPELAFINNTEAKTWNGVHYFVMPGGFDPDTGGGNTILLEDSVFSSPAAGVIDTYMWHKSVLGFGSSYDISAKITYENTMTSWLYNNTGNAGWKVLQAAGVKRLRIKIDAALSLAST